MKGPMDWRFLETVWETDGTDKETRWDPQGNQGTPRRFGAGAFSRPYAASRCSFLDPSRRFILFDAARRSACTSRTEETTAQKKQVTAPAMTTISPAARLTAAASARRGEAQTGNHRRDFLRNLSRAFF